MRDVPRQSLAQVYATWTELYGVTVADIVRVTGLSRHTIENVRDGGSRRTTQRTLQRMATGIVTGSSRRTRYDAIIMTDCFRALSLAAGYGDPTAAEASDLLALAMYYQFRSPGRAHRWAALVERFGAMDPQRAWAALEAAEQDAPSE